MNMTWYIIYIFLGFMSLVSIHKLYMSPKMILFSHGSSPKSCFGGRIPTAFLDAAINHQPPMILGIARINIGGWWWCPKSWQYINHHYHFICSHYYQSSSLRRSFDNKSSLIKSPGWWSFLPFLGTRRSHSKKTGWKLPYLFSRSLLKMATDLLLPSQAGWPTHRLKPIFLRVYCLNVDFSKNCRLN